VPASTSRAHPWHGLSPGPEPPSKVNAYIEITPRDVVKYELDKVSGLLQVDRVQQTSSSPPSLYGLIPGTYCGERVAALSPTADRADGDPLDICVLSEQPIDKADIVLKARVVGGLRMIDDREADDKIIAVLDNDPFWAHVSDISQLPPNVIDRLDHYFRTYKQLIDDFSVTIEARYGRDEAHAVVMASIDDYRTLIGE
jgi:inorganic pyrophosphatase